ncbi:transposase [Mangrovicoccus sp. HB161399]|uniref:transposase n=1 Tax=Mangrovicoccus sp. HB161399 TaxID=2720392 RepID=UPI001554BDF6
MNRQPRRNFTAEFKEQAVARLSEPGVTQASVAREMYNNSQSEIRVPPLPDPHPSRAQGCFARETSGRVDASAAAARRGRVANVVETAERHAPGM